MLDEWRQLFAETFTWEEPHAHLQDQLRAMYGRGEITAERFLELRTRLERNQIGMGDVQLAHHEALLRMRGEGSGESAWPHREIERSLNRLYIDRGLVEEARVEIARAGQTLAQEAGWVQRQADAARRNAQAALPDERQARTALATWQRLTLAGGDIEARRRGLQQELQRINDLEAELRAAIARLKLLDSQEHLAELDLHIRQDLFAQVQKR